MPLDSTGKWMPTLFRKQLQVFNSRRRALLVPGPRLSGKTRAVLHRIVRHLWETKGARVGMFARTMKSSKDGGTWSLLQSAILPEWFESKIGMRYTSSVNGRLGPKTDGLTRTPFFTVTNVHGGESTLLLFSLDDDNAVEDKLKELEFSMIYFSELDKFGDRRVLTVALPSLRMGHLRFEDQMWIADCNPSEEGENSWIYQTFFKERDMSYYQYCEWQKSRDLPTLAEDDFVDFYRRQLDVIEILPADNPYVDPRQLQEVKVACGSDAGQYARHVEGKWVWGGGDSSRHFRVLARQHLQVIGKAEGNEDDWIYANPHSTAWELVLGFDLGETNHAAFIIDKEYVNGRACFTVVDELVSIGQDMSLYQFTTEFMELIERLEEVRGPGFKYNLERAWSDRNSLEKYSAAADRYPYEVVAAASDDRIILRGVGTEAKARGSIRMRVNLLKELLAADRLGASAHCVATLAMFRDLRKGNTPSEYVVQDQHKHVFDGLSYPLFMECEEEMQTRSSERAGKRSPIIIHG